MADDQELDLVRVFRSGNLWAVRLGDQGILLAPGEKPSAPVSWGSLMAHLHVMDPWEAIDPHSRLPRPVAQVIAQGPEAAGEGAAVWEESGESPGGPADAGGQRKGAGLWQEISAQSDLILARLGIQ